MDYWFVIAPEKAFKAKTRPLGYNKNQASSAFQEAHKAMDDWIKRHGVTLKAGNQPFTKLQPLLNDEDGEYATPLSGCDTTAIEDNDEGLSS